MSEYFDENIVKKSVLFDRTSVDEFNEILSKKHNFLFFEHNWYPRQYIENESPRSIFMIALLNAYFLFHEAAPMSTEQFNRFWGRNSLIIEQLKHICTLRNLFAHNYIKNSKSITALKWFVKDIDDSLPAKLVQAYDNICEHYLFTLPETNEFWGRSLEKICKMSDGILSMCNSVVENKDKNDIENDYMGCYKRYILRYFENNYRKKCESDEIHKQCIEKIDSIMDNKFLTNWEEKDIYPETICVWLIKKTS